MLIIFIYLMFHLFHLKKNVQRHKSFLLSDKALPKDKTIGFAPNASKQIVLVFINDENDLSLWRPLEPQCGCSAPRLAAPPQIVCSRAERTTASVRCVFPCRCFSGSVSWSCLSCFSWDGSATSLLDSLPGRPVLVSIAHLVPRRNFSVPSQNRLLFHFDAISFDLQTEASAVTPLLSGTPSLVSVLTFFSPSQKNPPGNRIILWGVTTRWRPLFFSHRLPHLSLPLKPQGLNRHWLREKTWTTRILTYKLLLTSASFSYFLCHWVLLEGQECSERLRSRRLHMTECCY